MAELTRRHRLRKLKTPRGRVVLIALAALLVMFQAYSTVRAQWGQEDAQTTTAVVEQQRDGAAAQAASLASQIKTECADGTLTGPLCEQAEKVADAPVPGPIGPIGPSGEPGPPPTPEQIRGAVDQYLIENPPPAGRAPTANEVAAAVAGYLVANPPSPGRPPTAAEISDAVQVYFANNPPPAGPTGDPGRPPTADEIRAAVAEYLAANPPPAGPAGASGADGGTGAQGVGVQDVQLEQGTCELVFVLVDPADGSTSERRVPLAAPACTAPVVPDTPVGP
jgi:hypothetical protein